MLVDIKDKKVREYLKSMYLDFKLSPMKNEESISFTDTLRKVVKNNKVNLLSGGLILNYVSNQLNNSRSYYLEQHMSMREDLSYIEHILVIEEVYQEWEYLMKWFEEIFIVEDSCGLRTIKLREVNNG